MCNAGPLIRAAPRVFICAVLLGISCQTPTIPSIPIETLLEAPEAVQIGGRTYVLETYLWRDFMPISPPDGSDLMAVALLTAVDREPFPDDIDANRLWIIHGDEVWETKFSGENRPRDGAHLYQLEKFASGGPKWPIGARVQVVVRIITRSGLVRLLRAADQPINRTD